MPKGHQEVGETDNDTALRELYEETKISKEFVDLNPSFQYVETYFPTYKRFGNEKVQKTITIFLGFLIDEKISVVPSEHPSYEWLDWNPPHKIQDATINGLLSKLESYIHN